MLDLLLVLAGALTLLAVAGTQLTRRFGVPAMLLFVALGMGAGSSGLGLVYGDYGLSHALGTVALAVILIAGGVETDPRALRPALPMAALLSTVGVAIKAVVVGAATVALLGWSWADALLLGAILAPTDAAAVFQVLGGKGLRPRLQAILEAESGTNDPVSIFLAATLTAAAIGTTSLGPALFTTAAAGLLVQLALGAAIGALGGRTLGRMLGAMRPEARALIPIGALMGGLALFGATNLLGGNGYLAAYVAGAALGASALPYARQTLDVIDGAAWAAQIGLFVLLGLLSAPDQALPLLPRALAITAVAVGVARPLAVGVAAAVLRLGGERLSAAEIALLSWGGLKGAVPIVLAIGPLLAGHPAGEALFHVVLVVVLAATALQGVTVVPLARALGLLDPPPPAAPVRVAVDAPVPLAGGVLDVPVTPQTAGVGRTLRELDLPADVVVAAVLRDGVLLPGRGSTCLHAGDHLLVVVADRGAPLPQALRPTT